MKPSLDDTFSALADGTRRAILAEMAGRELTLSDLAAPHRMTLTGVMKHVRVLERAGLLKREKRGRTVWCRLDPAPLHEAAEWVGRYRGFWEGAFDALTVHLERQTKPGRPE